MISTTLDCDVLGFKRAIIWYLDSDKGPVLTGLIKQTTKLINYSVIGLTTHYNTLSILQLYYVPM